MCFSCKCCCNSSGRVFSYIHDIIYYNWNFDVEKSKYIQGHTIKLQVLISVNCNSVLLKDHQTYRNHKNVMFQYNPETQQTYRATMPPNEGETGKAGDLVHMQSLFEATSGDRQKRVESVSCFHIFTLTLEGLSLIWNISLQKVSCLCD